MTIPRALALSVSTLFLCPLPAQSGGGFSTGPVTGPPPGAPVLAPATAPGPSLPSPVASIDVRVNQALIGQQNETSLAVNPNDPRNLVATANDYRFGQPETGWYTSLDGGATWTTGTFGIDAGYSFSGDPAVTFDTQGTAHVVCMMYAGPGGVNQVKAFRSFDGGLTWQPGVQLGVGSSGFDKPQVEADLGPVSPNRDHLLVAWNEFNTVSGDQVLVAVSSDQGATWSAPQAIANGPLAIGSVAVGPDVAWGRNGEAYVMWADQGAWHVRMDRSFDNGATWGGVDRKVADINLVPSALPGSGFRVFPIFALHADQSAGPFGGRVYVAFHDWDWAIGADVLVTTSSDQGATWTPPVKITNDGVEANDQLFPGIVVDRQGNVDVTFYDQRNDPQDHLLWTWVARSSDGGATWTEHAISDVGWNCTATESGLFIGDYLDLDADRHGLLRPLWCDGRTGSQDIYTDAVNLQLSTDLPSVSVASGGVVTFAIRIGPNHAGEGYVLAASGTGTHPGVAVGNGVVVPLVPDFWTDLSLQLAGSAVLPGSIGTLAPGGAAQAQLVLPPLPAALAGATLHFAAVAFGATAITHATPPARVALVP